MPGPPSPVDLESPADAWYVWLATALVSVAIAGLVLQLPSQPPPDAAKAAETVDRVVASEYSAAGTYRHDADEVRFGPERIALRNDGGTDRATVGYGRLVHVRAVQNATVREALRDLLYQRRPATETIRPHLERVAASLDDETGQWYPAGGTFRARTVSFDDRVVVLVDG